MAQRKACPHCNAPALAPSGPKDSKILIIYEFPSSGDINFCAHWTGPDGRVLKSELAKSGIDYKSCRICTMNLHAPNKSENCTNLAMKVLLKEAEGRKGILLVGTECAKLFVGKSLDGISGLRVEDDVSLISAPVIICAPNPSLVIIRGGVVGEFRLALQRFGEAVEPYMEEE